MDPRLFTTGQFAVGFFQIFTRKKKSPAVRSNVNRTTTENHPVRIGSQDTFDRGFGTKSSGFQRRPGLIEVGNF